MQSKKHSIFEALTNQSVAFILALLMYHFIIPLVTGVPTSVGTSIVVTILFTIMSLVRSYVVRRFFNKKTIAEYEANKDHFVPERKYNGFSMKFPDIFR